MLVMPGMRPASQPANQPTNLWRLQEEAGGHLGPRRASQWFSDPGKKGTLVGEDHL